MNCRGPRGRERADGEREERGKSRRRREAGEAIHPSRLHGPVVEVMAGEREGGRGKERVREKVEENKERKEVYKEAGEVAIVSKGKKRDNMQ